MKLNIHKAMPAATALVPLLAAALACGCGRQGAEVAEYEEITLAKPAPVADRGFQHPPMGDGFEHPPIGDGSEHPSMGGTMPPTMSPGAASAGPAMSWTTPEGWREEKGQGMRLATFLAAGDAGEVECSLIVLGGAAGGLPANVNRWIGQLGMDTLSTEDMDAFLARQAAFETEGEGGGVLIDLTTLSKDDDAEAKSMVVGVVNREGKTIFAKMMGSVSALQAERDRLQALCSSFN